MNDKVSTDEWSLSSWRSKPIFQQPPYNDQEKLIAELKKISELPPLVSFDEIKELRRELLSVKNGEKFIIQLGDCAERFDDCKPEIIQEKIAYYNLVANVFSEITKTTPLILGRIAGQYAKPRSDAYETIDGKKVITFRGENVNSIDPEDREPNPKRLTEGYFHAAATLNYIRQLNTQEIYEKYVDSHNFEEYKIDLKSYPSKSKIQSRIYTCHEALLLDYEESLVREDEGNYYGTSSHLLWIGERTRQLGGAHVEMMRALENPIGLKISSSLDENELVRLIKLLNPHNIDGKLVLITRMGARNVETCLPKLITAVEQEKLNVLWVCDAVHGNTVKLGDVKTRKLDDVRDELMKTVSVFKKLGKNLNGIHLEITPDTVTECIGGNHAKIGEKDLRTKYTSYCDPRLNFSQGLELAVEVATELIKN